MLRRGFIASLAFCSFWPKLFKEKEQSVVRAISFDLLKSNPKDAIVDWTAYIKPINKAESVLHFYGGFSFRDIAKIRKDICKYRADQWVLKFIANAINKGCPETEAVLIWHCLLVSFRCPRMDGFEVLNLNGLYEKIKSKDVYEQST